MPTGPGHLLYWGGRSRCGWTTGHLLLGGDGGWVVHVGLPEGGGSVALCAFGLPASLPSHSRCPNHGTAMSLSLSSIFLPFLLRNVSTGWRAPSNTPAGRGHLWTRPGWGGLGTPWLTPSPPSRLPCSSVHQPGPIMLPQQHASDFLKIK